MSQLGEAMVPIRATLDKLDTDLANARSKIENALTGAWNSAQKVGQVALTAVAVGAVAAVTAVAGIGMAGINAFGEFQGQMNEVFTLLPGISESAMDQMSADVLEFSKDFAVLPEEVVPSLYQALSAGVPADNVFSFLETAQMAAVGGVTELETAVDGISSVVNAYGEDVLDAATASDVMFTAVRLGKTDFEQLSTSLFNVIPTAASLGVKFGDVAAQLATLTAQGTPTSVATTQIRAALVEASKSGTLLSDAINNLTGHSFAELIEQGGTVPEIFQQLRQSMPEQEFKDLFGSVEAMNAVLGVTGPNFETVSAAMEQMNESAGATNAAYDTMNQGIERSKERFQAFVSAGLIQVGNALSPLIDMVIEFGTNALPVIESVLNTAVIPAVEHIASALGFFFDDVSAGGSIIEALAGLLYGLAFDGFGATEAQALALYDGILQVWEIVQSVTQPIIDAVAGFVEWQDVLIVLAGAILAVVIPAIVSLVVSMAPIFLTIAAAIAIVALMRQAWENDWGGIQGKVATVIEFISNLITSVMAFVRDFWAANGEEILATAQNIWQTISDFINTTITTIQAIITTVATAIATFWQAHGQAILTTAQTIWQTISDFITGVWDILTALFAAFKSAFEGDWYSFGENLRIAWDTAWQTILNLLSGLWDLVRPILTNLITSVIDKFTSTDWGSIGRGIIDGIAGAISGGVGAIINAAQNAAQAALDAALGFLGIGSPSRVAAEEIGLPFVEGIAAGIGGGQRLLANSMRDLLSLDFPPLGGPSPAFAGDGSGTTFIFNFPADMARRDQSDIERMIDAAMTKYGIRAEARIRTR